MEACPYQISRTFTDRFLQAVCGLIAIASLIATPARAATLTWDASGSSFGSPTDGSGTWSGSNGNWSNGTSDAAWSGGNDAAIGNGGTAGTITVSGSLSVGNITFNPVASGTYYTITGSAITLTGATITLNASNAVINSVLAGSAGLTTTGTGTLTLGGANTYSGNTNVNGGSTLVVGTGASITNSGQINLGNSGTGTLTISGGTITNTAGAPCMEIGIGGPGTFNLTSGTASFSNGYIIAGAGGAATFNQSGGVFNLANNQTFYLGNSSGSPVTFNLSGGSFTMGTGAVMQVGVRSNTSLNISGSASVSIGTVQLGNVNAASGLSNQFNLNGGTLITSAITYSADSFTSSLNGGTLQAGSSTASLWNNNSSVAATIGASGFTVNTAGFNDTISQAFGGTGTLTKTGAGTLTLTGANTFGGGVAISSGTVNISAPANLGGSSSGVTFTGAGTLQAGTNSIVLPSTRTLTINPGVTGTIDTQSNTMTINGAISGSTGALTKVGSGTLILGGVSTYGGATSINAGTLYVSGTLGNTAVAVGNGANVAGTGLISGAVTVNGGGAINLVDGSIGTLTLGGGLSIGNNTTASILDFEGVGSSFDLLNDSAGMLSLSGSVTINITALGSLSAGTYNLITFGSLTGSLANFTLGSNQVNGKGLTLLSTGTAEQLVVTGFTAYWKGGNGTSWNAGGPTNWTSDAAGTTGTSAPTSAVDVNFSANGVTGPLTTSLGANFDVGSLNFTSGATGSTTISDGTYGLTLEGGGISVNAGAGAVTISATGVRVKASQSWLNNSSNALTVTSPVMGAAATSSTTTLTLIGSGAGGILLGGAILDGTAGGKLALNIIGSTGTVELTASNSYSGGTTVSTGTLQLGDGVTSNGSVTGGITDNGTLVIANPLAQTFNNVVSGSGAVMKSGPGTLTLGANANNTYSGPTAINGGTLKLDLSAQTGQIILHTTYSIGASGTMEILDTQTGIDGEYFQNMVISGSGTLNKTGPGDLEFYATSSIKNFTGQVNVIGGTLGSYNIDWGSSVGQMSLFVSGSANFDMRGGNDVINQLTGSGTIGSTGGATATLSIGNNNGSATFSGSINNNVLSGGGATISLAKNGTGTQVLSGSNGYTGATTIDAGTLQIGNGGINGSISSTSGVSGSSGGTLVFNTSLSGTFSPSISGGINFTQSSASTLTLANASYSGTTSVNAGTLIVAGSLSGKATVTGATLGGNVSFGGDVTVGNGLGASSSSIICPSVGSGAISQGISVGGNLFLASDAAYQFKLDSNASDVANNGGFGPADMLFVTGTFNIATGAVLTGFDIGDASAAIGTQYFIADAVSGFNGSFSNAPQNGTIAIGAFEYSVDYTYGDGNGGDYLVLTSVAAVPEPGTWGLLFSGLGILGFCQRRRSASPK